MITFLVLFSLMGLLIEAEAYMNYGTIIITKEAFIVPLIFGLYGQILEDMLRWVYQKKGKG